MSAISLQNFNIPSTYYCYILQSIEHPTRTYVGFTTNPTRRIRQHNREIVGGAKRTFKHYPWTIICLITGFHDKRSALQFEWANQHHKPRRYSIKGRIQTLEEILWKERWTSTAPLSTEVPLAIIYAQSSIYVQHCPEYCQQFYWKVDE